MTTETDFIDSLAKELAKALDIDDLIHDPGCASLRGYMVGGVSTNINVPPKAHMQYGECDCRLSGKKP